MIEAQIMLRGKNFTKTFELTKRDIEELIAEKFNEQFPDERIIKIDEIKIKC